MGSFRFVHVGVAALLAAAAVSAVGVLQTVNATGTASSFVPIVPCRLADTRPGSDHVGTVAAAIGAGQTAIFAIWGTNGNCTIPSNATAIATNVTAVNANAASYLTIYPADANPRPSASNLNYFNGSPPTPNQVTVALSASGAIGAYNNAGSVDIIIDIVGYYQPGGQGTQGIQGAPGPRGYSAWDVIPSGVTVTGTAAFDGHQGTGADLDSITVDLPAVAPVALTSANVNFRATGGVDDADPTCTGTFVTPTAPAGKVCLYLYTSFAVRNISGYVSLLPTRAFSIGFYPISYDNWDEILKVVWAYTAP